MRVLLAAVSLLLAAGSVFRREGPADPYAWCAEYGGGRGGGRNCYFVTLEQCRWTISGNGGMCTPNPFYDRARQPTDRGRAASGASDAARARSRAALLAAAASDPAQADPYRWCADYGGRTGGTNCYFVTLEQCRAAISGMTAAPAGPTRSMTASRSTAPRPARRAKREPMETPMRIALAALRAARRRRGVRRRQGRSVPLVRPLQRQRRQRHQLLFHLAGAMPLGGVRRRRLCGPNPFYDGVPIGGVRSGRCAAGAPAGSALLISSPAARPARRADWSALSALATKPDAFISSTKLLQIVAPRRRGPSACPSPALSP